MAEALSSAKRQSVKEIKQNANKKRKRKLIIKWSLIIVIVAILAFLINNYVMDNAYTYTDHSTGIKFSSKDFQVKDVFEILSADSNFNIIFNITPKDMNKLSTITNQIIFVQSTLSAKNKNTTLIINVMDNQRRTISCQSNLGDNKINQELTKEECDDLVKSKTTAFIMDYPDTSLEETNVYTSVGEKYIYIQSNSLNELDKAIILSLSMMFEDMDNIKQRVEQIKNKVDTNLS